LTRHPAPLYRREIAKKLRMKGGHLDRSLRRLVEVGFARREETEHKVYYSLTERGREEWKEYKATLDLKKSGLSEAFEMLEAKIKGVEEKYPNLKELSETEKFLFAHEVMNASGEVLLKCFTKMFTTQAMRRLPKYMKLMLEAYQILNPPEMKRLEKLNVLLRLKQEGNELILQIVENQIQKIDPGQYQEFIEFCKHEGLSLEEAVRKIGVNASELMETFDNWYDVWAEDGKSGIECLIWEVWSELNEALSV